MSIKEDVREKFNIALMLNKEEAGDVIEKIYDAVYIKRFFKVSETYKIPAISKISREIYVDTGSAKDRIPKWPFNTRAI